MLWNIRKKKFIAMIIAVFVISTLVLILPVIASRATGVAITANPNYAITFGSSFIFILLAIVTGMNSISSEFESGTIVPLVTKPVSRTMIFLGKLFGAFIILLVSYVLLYGYVTVASLIVYGSQNNLQYMPFIVVGAMISTFIWVSLMFLVGSVTKNTILTVIVAIILFLALLIGVPVVTVYSGPSQSLNYLPGMGASGNILVGNGTSVSAGTDNIGANLVNYALYPSANVTYFRTNSTALTSGNATAYQTNIISYTEPTSLVALRSIGVAATYIAGFLVVAWFAFKRSQILE
jgi:ABC-type transport system involved in multi-copper enzyme maturation permease subunit